MGRSVTDVSMNEYNREQKRLLQRQGQLDAEGMPVARREPRPGSAPARGGFRPRQFLDEVVLELRKVMKPKRPELVNYASVVFFTLVFVTALVYGLDYVYSLGAAQIFK
jgi:preprotein translocase subunit SecE